MTIADIITKITQNTGADTSSTGYPSANRLIDINSWQHIVETMIRDSQDESDFDDVRNTSYPIKYLTMVALQRDFSIPQTDKTVAIKRVDVTYDGVNYYRALPIDSGEMEGGLGLSSSSVQELTTDGLYSTTTPRYDYKYGALFVYPRATQAQVNAGATIKYEGTREITEFTSGEVTTGTAIPGFDSAFHPFLHLGPSFDYCTINSLPQAKGFQMRLQELETRLRRHYGSKQKDRDIQLVGGYQNYK